MYSKKRYVCMAIVLSCTYLGMYGSHSDGAQPKKKKGTRQASATPHFPSGFNSAAVSPLVAVAADTPLTTQKGIQRFFGEFSKLSIVGSFIAQLRGGEKNFITCAHEASDAKKIHTRVDSDGLFITCVDPTLICHIALVCSSALREISLTGSAKVVVDATFIPARLTLRQNDTSVSEFTNLTLGKPEEHKRDEPSATTSPALACLKVFLAHTSKASFAYVEAQHLETELLGNSALHIKKGKLKILNANLKGDSTLRAPRMLAETGNLELRNNAVATAHITGNSSITPYDNAQITLNTCEQSMVSIQQSQDLIEHVTRINTDAVEEKTGFVAKMAILV